MTNKKKFYALQALCAKYDNKCTGCPLNYHDNDIGCGVWIYAGKQYDDINPSEYAKINKCYDLAFNKQDNGQQYKADAGKPRVSLVPMQIVRDIAVIRQYGVDKYKTVDNWKNVEKERYVDALGRHALAFLNDPLSVDEESGLPHLWHLECNASFLSELMKGAWEIR